jgi:transposase-like protein
VIVLAVRWYLRFGLSYRDVEELLGERGIEVHHVTLYRWVQRFSRYSWTPPGRVVTRSDLWVPKTHPCP